MNHPLDHAWHKGGAAGGGYSQVVPMEDINLHFTGDLHAITAAHNLLAAMVDNHIQQGNELNIDPRRVVWNRVMDMNDRVLRHIVVGLGGHANGVPREGGFDITVASEVMAILCLADSIHDMKERFARIIVGYTYDNKPVTAGDIHAQGAMTALMKDALKPNLVQTLEHVPAFIHGGPFANIAHGCNSVLATRTALHLADYVVTEAGFGADLGAEKFLDIKCRFAGLKPDAAVLVATIRALKMNGGKAKNELTESDPEAVKRGLPNLLRHMHNLKKYGLPIVVALNMFPSDTEEEKKVAFEACKEAGVPVAESTVFADGGEGGLDLGEKYWQPLIRDPITSRFMIWTFPLRKRLKPLQKKFMALTAWHLTVPLQKNWRTLKKWDTERCLSALQRHRYPSVMIRPSWEHLQDLHSMSEKSKYLPAQALSSL